MIQIIIKILILSVSIFLIAKLLPGIRVKSFRTAIGVAVVYSIINFLVGWILKLLALPLILITFGLFIFMINATLLWITDKIIDDFEIDGFGLTILAAFLITIVNSILDWIL
jgi:putative membrane protein